jgi:hypothetical protein
VSHFIRNGILVLFCLAVALVGFALPRNAAMAQSAAALGGPWNGTWEGGNFRYEAVMSLNVDGSSNVDGSINWTLRVSPRANEQAKIGMKGVEYVRGKYYPDSATLVLEGYRKDDPNNILGLDKYRLVISPTGRTMGGLSEHHGTWTGRFFLTH